MALRLDWHMECRESSHERQLLTEFCGPRMAEIIAWNTGNPRWKGMTWGMVPLLGGAFAACTFHFFYNSPDVGFLVPLQAFLTFAGNTTLAIAAYRIYAAAEKPAEP